MSPPLGDEEDLEKVTRSARKRPAAKTKHDLHRVYYRQRKFHLHQGRWGSLKELGLDLLGVRLETTSSRFEASAAVPGTKARWRIAEDARIVRDAHP